MVMCYALHAQVFRFDLTLLTFILFFSTFFFFFFFTFFQVYGLVLG